MRGYLASPKARSHKQIETDGNRKLLTIGLNVKIILLGHVMCTVMRLYISSVRSLRLNSPESCVQTTYFQSRNISNQTKLISRTQGKKK